MHSQTKRSSTPFTLVRSTRPGQSALQKAANDSPRIAGLQALQAMANPAAQRMEEDELQMKPIQRMDDEELMQGKLIQRVEEDELQMKPIQRMEEDELQGKFIQRAAEPKTNNTGLPDNLRAGIENLSGMSMDGVKVHRNSDKPAAVQAHAYAQGSDIHLAPGQEKHLPHEAWHVVQQAQGRVKPTMQLQGVAVNDDAGLEAEADVMGAKALQRKKVKPSKVCVTQFTRDNIVLSHAAKKHFDHHFDADLPSNQEELIAKIRAGYFNTKVGEFTLQLGTFETKNVYDDETRDRKWTIVVVEKDNGVTLVKHYGPSS